MRSDTAPAGQNQWVIHVVGGSFLLVGLAMVMAGIKLFLATRLPETIVEVDTMPVQAGRPFLVTMRQP
jgi:hypothetical protein